MATGAPSRTAGLTAAITVGIVVTTLLTAVAGWLQVRSSKLSGAQAQLGQQLAIQAGTTIQQAQTQADVDYEAFLRAEEQRGDAGNALQQGLFATGELALALQLKQSRSEALAGATEALTPISQNGPYGPQADDRFPDRFFASRTQDALRIEAQQDAANRENSAWEEHAATYTAILTLFAVALYLFGFALALPERMTRAFGVVATVLVVLGVGWGVKTALSAPQHVPEQAAREFAAGVVGTETASDAQGYAAARAHYDRAIQLWPGFARAYLGRAMVTLTAASPKLIDVSIPPDALTSAISDLGRARDLGLDTVPVLETLASAEFSLALHGHPELYERSADLAQQLVRLIPDDPVARYTLSFGLLGAGRVQEAASAFHDAVLRTIYPGGDTSKTAISGPFQEVWVAGALTDLDAMGTADSSLRETVSRFKEELVASVSAGSPAEPSGQARASGVQVQVSPTTVAWGAQGLAGFDVGTDRLSVQWYSRPPGVTAWVGMPEVSGTIDPERTPSLPNGSAANLLSSSIPARCLAPGDYRVELYVNGHLAGGARAAAPFGELQGYVDRALNLEVCHPAGWTLSDRSLTGFRDALVTPEGSQGVVLFRYNLASLPASLATSAPDTLAASLIGTSVQDAQDVLPSQAAGAVPGQVQHSPFAGLQGATEQALAYGDQLVFVEAGIDPNDRAAFVAMTFGPQQLFAPTAPGGQSLATVASSIGEYRFGGGSF